MKKIIATVLAMVMALALCTTAFAAEMFIRDRSSGSGGAVSPVNPNGLGENGGRQLLTLRQRCDLLTGLLGVRLTAELNSAAALMLGFSPGRGGQQLSLIHILNIIML